MRANELMEAIKKEYGNTDAQIKFVKLLAAVIDELRVKNDSADTKEVFRNQGAIAELRRIIKGISMAEKYFEHTGAFNE